MDKEILNQSQLEAVTSTEGFIRVIAGTGSGKTRALSHRFAYLVNDKAGNHHRSGQGSERLRHSV